MSWKTIVVKESDRIFVKKSQFGFQSAEKEALIPFSDIDCVVLENNYTRITTQVLAKLAENNIFLLVCNDKHDVVGVFLAFNQHWKPLSVFRLQIKMGSHFKKRIWTNLIKQKIWNAAMILEKLRFKQSYIQDLKKIYRRVDYHDVSNREGQAANYFFRCLFGSNFVRTYDGGINAALNYGYKVIMSAVNRSLTKYGLQGFLGVRHCNQENPFNLSCDLMEPLRPIVDYVVYTIGEEIADHLTYNHRIKLLELLQFRVCLDKHLRTITNAIDVMVKSFLTALKNDDPTKLLLPTVAVEENVYQSDLE